MRNLIYSLVLLLAACGGGGGGGTVTPAVTQSLCALKAYSATYPDSYLGSNTIPTPTQKFDANVMRGIGLKDYHPRQTNDGCAENEYARLLYKNTLARLKTLGVDTVEIYQYGPIDDFSIVNWTASESNWQIPKTELVWLINEAHSRGLKVTLVWQLWPLDTKGAWIDPQNSSQENLDKILNGWNSIITKFAKVAGDNNVDNLSIQWSAFYLPSVVNYSEYSTQKFLTLIDNVRSVFKGKLFMGTPRFYDKRIIDKVDAIVVPLGPSPWSVYDDTNISVSLLKERTMNSITSTYLDFSLYSGMDPKDIPVIWDFNVQSRDKFLSNGWVEDGFCIVPGTSGAPASYDNPLCVQKNYVTDFSIQAMVIEGAFEAIKDQKLFKTYGVNFSTGYWHTDTLVPGPEGFPNLSQSIRGKPAENIVKAWYQK